VVAAVPRRASGSPPPACQAGPSGRVAAPSGAVLALPGGSVATGGDGARTVLLWPPSAMGLSLRVPARSGFVGPDLGLEGPGAGFSFCRDG
jgi:hypothetical protein